MPKLLWVSPFCLLDISSGASVAIRTLLHALETKGFSIQILSATIFDHPNGTKRLQGQWEAIKKYPRSILTVRDGSLRHLLVTTQDTNRGQMTSDEEEFFLSAYGTLLRDFAPDYVFTYGGRCLDYSVVEEASVKGIPVIQYLANENYATTRFCRHASVILTNTRTMRDYYQEKLGISCIPIGSPIDPDAVVAKEGERENVLFVNPAYAKGITFLIPLILRLASERPDIHFEIVDTKNVFHEFYKETLQRMGRNDPLPNTVHITQATDDMRAIFGRARCIIAPSLWFECFGRVCVEAMLNGVPAIVSNRGGLPEVVGKGGIVFEMPKEAFQKPYTRIFSLAEVTKVANTIKELYDNEKMYAKLSQKARLQSRQFTADRVAERFIHAIEKAT